MSNYATLAQVKDYKIAGQLVDLGLYDDAEIQERLNLAELVLENFTNTLFYSQTQTIYLDGNHRVSLPLYPKLNYPVISVTSLFEINTITGDTLFTYTSGMYNYRNGWYLQLSKDNTYTGGCMRDPTKWPKGLGNIKLTGTFGRSAVPTEVKHAAILLALESLMPGSTRMDRNNIVKREWEDFKLSYAGQSSDPIPPQASTGFEYVDRLLSKYCITPALFLVPDDNFLPVGR